MRNPDHAQHFYDQIGVIDDDPPPLQRFTTQEEPMTQEHTESSLVAIGAAPFTWKTLNAIANTEFVPAPYRGKPEKMLGAILYGRECGLQEMTSMQMIDMVDGKPSMSAELQVAMVRRAGHSILCSELSDQTCTVEGIRHDTHDSMSYTFTIAQADRAGLLEKTKSGKKTAWHRYPEAMLWARAVSQLCRMLFPDVMIAMHNYTPEEIGRDTTDLVPPDPRESTEPEAVIVDTTHVPPIAIDQEDLPIEYADDDPERPF